MNSFSELNLHPSVQRGLSDVEYTTPTPIQAAAIPHLLEGRDLLGCAQTGTGKTAAFALPILHHLAERRQPTVPKRPRALVLSPTRELADQIGDSFKTYGRHVRHFQTVIYGGVNQFNQVKALNRGVHVVIATPGRLLDLMNQGHISLDDLEIFVLDEADRMLDMGFLPDLRRIIAALPEQRQSLFFSATLPDHAKGLVESLLRNPVTIAVTPQSSTVERIDQKVLFVERSDKRALLNDILSQGQVGQTLVFTRTKRGADVVARNLDKRGIRADAIHGNKTQAARNRVLHGFRTGRVQVLVATDIAARGIDVEGITHVINYDLPHEPESYVHRIGRTGRAGAVGVALTFCDSEERKMLRAIERLIQTRIAVHADHPFHSQLAAAAEPAPQRKHGPQGKNARGRRSKFRGPKGPVGRSGEQPGPDHPPQTGGDRPGRRSKSGVRVEQKPPIAVTTASGESGGRSERPARPFRPRRPRRRDG